MRRIRSLLRARRAPRAPGGGRTADQRNELATFQLIEIVFGPRILATGCDTPEV
jgi:hypothetical protein